MSTTSPFSIPPALREKLSKVRLFFCDVDGVLTDGSIFIGLAPEQKRFNIRDGLGMQLLQKAGIRVGWVSFRPSPATRMRADELKIDFLIQEKRNKVEGLDAILNETGHTWPEVCFVGDDVVDLGAMKRAGCAVAVADAVTEAKQLADYIASERGGHGAVREVVELILKAQDKWQRLVDDYSL